MMFLCAEPCKDKKEEVPLDVSNLNPSSNPQDINNLVNGVGSPKNTWQPTDSDTAKTVKITLPEVNGVPPGQYDIMEVKIKPTGELGPVTVQILDKNGDVVYEVNTILIILYFTNFQ